MKFQTKTLLENKTIGSKVKNVEIEMIKKVQGVFFRLAHAPLGNTKSLFFESVNFKLTSNLFYVGATTTRPIKASSLFHYITLLQNPP